MANIDEWLARKYDIAQQEADANSSRADASMTAANASMQDAISQSGLRGEQSKWIGPTAQSEANLRRAQGGHLNSLTSEVNFRTDASKQYNLAHPLGLPGLYGIGDDQQTSLYNRNLGIGRKKGDARVTDKTGHGSPYVDTVPAKLADGEAVLNAGAAELMGRDQIEHLNKQGLRHMGMSEHSAMGGFNVSTGNINAATGYVPFSIPGTAADAEAQFAPKSNFDKFGEAFRQNLGGDAENLRKLVPSSATVQKVANVAGPLIQRVGNVVKPAGAAFEVGDAAVDMANPNVGWGLKGLRALETGSKLAGGVIGGALGGAAGTLTGPGAVVATPALGLAGGVEGYNLPGQIVHAFGGKLPSEQIAAINAKAAAGPASAEAPKETALQIAERNASILKDTKSQIDEANKAAIQKNDLVHLAIAGNTGAQKILSDQSDLERANLSAGLRGSQAGPLSIYKNIVDKNGNTVGVKDDQTTAILNEQFLPKYAQMIGKPFNKLTAEDKAAAKTNFNVMLAANKAGAESGNGFQFNSPVMSDQMEYLPSLPINSSGARGENTLMQGLRAKLDPTYKQGGLKVKDAAGRYQTIPMEGLDLTDPDMYSTVKALMDKQRAK